MFTHPVTQMVLSFGGILLVGLALTLVNDLVTAGLERRRALRQRRATVVHLRLSKSKPGGDGVYRTSYLSERRLGSEGKAEELPKAA